MDRQITGPGCIAPVRHFMLFLHWVT